MASIEHAAARHLAEQHTTIYGRSYDLIQDDSRADAIRWLAAEVRAVLRMQAEIEFPSEPG